MPAQLKRPNETAVINVLYLKYDFLSLSVSPLAIISPNAASIPPEKDSVIALILLITRL